MLLALLAAPATASGQEAPAGSEPPAVEDPRPAAADAVAAAWATVEASVAASARAESARRAAEEAVVEAHRWRQGAMRVLQVRRAALVDAEDALARAQAALEQAREQFDEAVVTAYKFGGTQGISLALTALQSAAGPHDAARALRELDAILGAHHDVLLRRTVEAEAATRRLAHLARLRDLAVHNIRQADEEIDRREDAADEARAHGARAEAALLAAAEVQLDREEAARAAGVVDPPGPVDAAPPTPALPPGPVAAAADAATDGGAPDPEASPVYLPAPPPIADSLATGIAATQEDPAVGVEDRRGWIERRRAALLAAGRLDASDRRVRRDLVCPVRDADFGNDWHLPRSHGRRHLGLDMVAPRSTPVRAMFDATITAVDAVDTYDGGEADLDGISVTYAAGADRILLAHLETVSPDIEEGVRVRAGQVVGTVGTSGNAQGGVPHLHLGWYVDDVPVNPYGSVALACADGAEVAAAVGPAGPSPAVAVLPRRGVSPV